MLFRYVWTFQTIFLGAAVGKARPSYPSNQSKMTVQAFME
jgi:hypothetical protein